jgi:c(7)-type cytochrome triheme protein
MTEAPEIPARNSLSARPERVAGGRHRFSLFTLVAGTLAFTFINLSSSHIFDSAAESQDHFLLTGLQNSGGGYSSFPHVNQAHSRLPCLLCHRRDNNSAQPIRSIGHTPCTGCHAQQFAGPSSPICAICHTNVESGKPQVKPFPSLKTFNMKFDHSRHNGVSCAACHKPEKRGVAFTIPAGPTAHVTCYKCHAPRAQANGRDISSCGTCHVPGSYSPTPEWAKAFRVSFSHSRHERKGLSCDDCHSVREGAARRRQVISPVPTQHFPPARGKSCASCHDDTKAFGGDDFSDCKRCHQGSTFRF